MAGWYAARQAGWLDVERVRAADLAERLAENRDRLDQADRKAATLAGKLDQVIDDRERLHQDKAALLVDLADVHRQLDAAKADVKAANALTLDHFLFPFLIAPE